mmetsp:Transcript_534/g.1523  ORF Transcript_534/g.1523 Transcript_534/m.1523 type:complete len:203 (-) Transcript_534:117-725(-)
MWRDRRRQRRLPGALHRGGARRRLHVRVRASRARAGPRRRAPRRPRRPRVGGRARLLQRPLVGGALALDALHARPLRARREEVPHPRGGHHRRRRRRPPLFRAARRSGALGGACAVRLRGGRGLGPGRAPPCDGRQAARVRRPQPVARHPGGRRHLDGREPARQGADGGAGRAARGARVGRAATSRRPSLAFLSPQRRGVAV